MTFRSVPLLMTPEAVARRAKYARKVADGSRNPQKYTPEQHRAKLARRRDYWKVNKDRLDVYSTSYKTSRWAREPFVLLYELAQSRAFRKKLPFDLTIEYLAERWTGKCALTGIPFVRGSGRGGATPFSPSLDRIDASRGYVGGNVRFVRHCVNAFKSNLSDREVWVVAKALSDPRSPRRAIA